LSRVEADERAMEFVKKVRLERVADAYPHTLSGGMKQRVAIARCLAMRPAIVLMDEPFAALDALARRQMQEELLSLWRESQFTMVFVTHSIDEALALGSRVILLSSHPGRVVGEWDIPQGGAVNTLHDQIEGALFGVMAGEPQGVVT
jgi:NitT/TauT family transport system ATP-binding protein